MGLKIEYTEEEILSSKPYEDIDRLGNDFDKSIALAKLCNYAKDNFGITSGVVKKFFKEYTKAKASITLESYETITGPNNLDLNPGDWLIDDGGIFQYRQTANGVSKMYACSHPIVPVERIINIDEGIEKLKIAFTKSFDEEAHWKTFIVERKDIASTNSIINLANYGVSVTTDNASALIKYLQDMEDLNLENIPVKKSVGRLGWIGSEGFSPYVEGLLFDGEANFKHYYESVKAKGSFSEWLLAMKDMRQKDNVIAKIALAASFSSVLVKKLHSLPYMVHICGGTEAGKTVALMVASSVWANPEMGKYIHTFDATSVAMEQQAGFVNNLPLIIDEFQILQRVKVDQLIYKLCEGVGKARGKKSGGLQHTQTWSNCIITSGEQPITSSSSGGGAVNRVCNLDCADTKLFTDPQQVVRTVRNNYGHAGKYFVELLEDEKIIEEATANKELFYNAFREVVTEKQAMVGAMIMTAEWIISTHIFEEPSSFGFDDIVSFLSTKEEVNQNYRAFEFLNAWVAQNRNKFIEEEHVPSNEIFGEIKKVQGHTAICILKNVFNKNMEENGFNPVVFSSWLKRRGKTICDKDRNRSDKKVRIDGHTIRCVVLKINDCDNLEEEE